MGQALYRKYRSKNLDEVIGQEHITKTLERALKSGKISHAYLFTGPRGVGKTSVARILAHEVNDLPYEDDSIHLDIIEIDAASNRRIDEIRELRDKVHISPTSAKYKVYIIDEVHMLTKEAFNALLKTLEEPPAHCIFILATTEVHKLPETIISRTQRFSFKPVGKSDISAHLNNIAKKEKINITAEALDLLAEHGQGSFRDSISLLDQLGASKEKITDDTVRSLIGLPPLSSIKNLLEHLKNGQKAQLLEDLENLSAQGVGAPLIARALAKSLRGELINGHSGAWIPPLLKELLDVPASTSPQDHLEISLLEAAGKTSQSTSPEPKDENQQPPTSKPSQKEEQSQKHARPAVKKEANKKPGVVNFDAEKWPQVVDYVKSHNASLYTALKLAKPEVSENVLVLSFQFPLHQKKVNQVRQRDLISTAVEEVVGSKLKVECVVNKEAFQNAGPNVQAAAEQPQKEFGNLQTISNIFGNAEMLS